MRPLRDPSSRPDGGKTGDPRRTHRALRRHVRARRDDSPAAAGAPKTLIRSSSVTNLRDRRRANRACASTSMLQRSRGRSGSSATTWAGNLGMANPQYGLCHRCPAASTRRSWGITVRRSTVPRRTKKPKPRSLRNGASRRALSLQKKSRQRPTLPHGFPCSTIGSEELNFRVREGIGCSLFDITTGNDGLRVQLLASRAPRLRPRFVRGGETAIRNPNPGCERFKSTSY